MRDNVTDISYRVVCLIRRRSLKTVAFYGLYCITLMIDSDVLLAIWQLSL